MRVRKNYTIEDLKKYAESKGGKCLSSIYLNSHTYYDWEDSKGRKWSAKWYPIKDGKWSPYEANEKRAAFNTDYAIEDLQAFALTKGGKCLSQVYTKNRDHYEWEDSKGRQFKMSWMNVVAGQWSPHEKRETLAKLKTRYTIENLKEFASQHEAECLSDAYGKASDLYLWKDKKGKTFIRNWYDIKRNNNVVYKDPVSFGHREIIDFIKELGINNIEINDRKQLEGKELDIYLPDYQLAIEFHGVKWHHSDRKKHRQKYLLCKEKNITLIQIFDIEWKDRREQIKSFLTSKLNKNKTTIYARKCHIKEISKIEAARFLDQYHIQGKGKITYAYGLYFNDELLSVISLNPHHRNNVETELSRYVCKTGITVAGGLSKLIVHAFKIHGEFVTWVDLRYSNGSNWLNNGWKLIHILAPDYFYVDLNLPKESRKMIPKQSRQKKKVNTPEGMTELEHATLDGLTRVYDAGKLKLSFSPVKS